MKVSFKNSVLLLTFSHQRKWKVEPGNTTFGSPIKLTIDTILVGFGKTVKNKGQKWLFF